MKAFKITSIQSEVADYSCRMIAEYLSGRLRLPIQFIEDLPWEEREEYFERGDIQACWMCGLPYILKVDHYRIKVDILAAPVMQFERYQNRPIYFSDVVVHRDSTFHAFSDLRGVSWAFNEPHSHSGYNITRYQLAKSGEGWDFFNRVIASGSHTNSLEMILDGEIDASAIDSTVLDLILAEKPAIHERIRVIDTWGPSPIPPWVVHSGVEAQIQRSLRQTLISMHQDSEGKAILERGQIDHFAQVEDQDYNPIRDMYKIAESIGHPFSITD
jgi:phosphonate transport system substrate-binding protein